MQILFMTNTLGNEINVNIIENPSVVSHLSYQFF